MNDIMKKLPPMLSGKQLEEAICFESEIQDYRADFKVYCLP